MHLAQGTLIFSCPTTRRNTCARATPPLPPKPEPSEAAPLGVAILGSRAKISAAPMECQPGAARVDGVSAACKGVAPWRKKKT